MGTKTRKNIACRDFQFGVYKVLYDFFLEMRLFTNSCQFELPIALKYREN